MYAIECDGVRIEADTEQEAKKAYRKTQAKARADRKQAEYDRSQAWIAAKLNGYRIYDRIMSDKTAPSAWICYSPNAQYMRGLCRQAYSDGYTTKVSLQSEEGLAHFELYRTSLVGIVIDGGGWPMALVLHEIGGEPLVYAVGTYKGQCCLELLHNVKQEWFNARY